MISTVCFCMFEKGYRGETALYLAAWVRNGSQKDANSGLKLVSHEDWIAPLPNKPNVCSTWAHDRHMGVRR